MKNAVLSLWICFFPALSGPIWAANYSDGISPQELEQLVQRALADMDQPWAPDLDTSRHFPRCESTPTVDLFQGQIDKVQIVCNAPRLWKRVLKTGLQPRRTVDLAPSAPVNLQNQVVLAKSLRAGAVIKTEDVTIVAAETASVALGFDDIAQVLGRRMNMPLGQGRVLQARHLEQDWTVITDQPVQIAYAVGSIQIIAPGRAQDNGQLGDLIWVENTSTGRRLRGVVASQNKILVQAKIK